MIVLEEKQLYNIYMRLVNPYIVGNPIKDRASFFGRQDIFREVMQVLRQPGSHAIVLYGQRRIGKTSVLLQLEKQLMGEGEFTPVYFDLQDKAAKSLAEVLYELSQHISKVTGHPPARPLDFDPGGTYFRGVFLPQIVEKIASGGLVLLFDEFDVLDSPMRTQASEAFFPYLREWMADVQKVKFVFVIGRRPEDLSVRTMSTFKGIQSTRVSFLSGKNAADVIRQSEREGSLEWEEEAVRRVLELTHGHPYFTQLLCSVIWENAYETTTHGTPVVSPQDVDHSISQALKFGANAFNWLWDGLPPAERVVVAAMAEVKDEIITQDKLIETLNLSGVRLVARELEFAPETLIDWEVLIEAGGAYRFAVPLLRRWVTANRPLRRVKEELDRLNPLADGLYQTGYGFYNEDNPDLNAAEQQLRQALNINPNHLKARLLLGQILLEKGNLAESVEMFDAAYQYDERSARADLIKSLLALAETQEENLQVSTYERILKIQNDQPFANEKLRAIWIQRGEAALAQEKFEEALKAFEQIDDKKRIEKARSMMHEKKLAMDLQRVDVYERSGQWKSALDLLLALTPEYPKSEVLPARLESARTNWRTQRLEALVAAETDEDWERMLELCETLEKDFPADHEIKTYAERARGGLKVTSKYHEALGALQSGDPDQARQILSQVLVENPKHLQAAHKLIEATYGKVRITRTVSWGAWLLVGFTSLLWILLGVVAASGLLWSTLIVTKLRNSQNIAIEPIILVVILLAALASTGIVVYTGRVLESAFQVEIKGKPSIWRAFWTHLPFGMGMFYVDRASSRKWLYPFLSMMIPITLTLMFTMGPYLIKDTFEKTKEINSDLFVYYEGTFPKGSIIRASEKSEWTASTWNTVMSVVGGCYLLSFADVMYLCYKRQRTYRLETREQLEKMPLQPLDKKRFEERFDRLIKRIKGASPPPARNEPDASCDPQTNPGTKA